VRCVPCSRKVYRQAKELMIPLATLNKLSIIDLTIDGADEVDESFNLIKGEGGALLREKIIAQMSLREIIIVDEAKLSPVIGTKRHVPIEVTPFGWQSHIFFLEELGSEVEVRRKSDGKLFKTDQDNIILDATFGPINEPSRLAADLKARAGIVEHGLFIRIATDIIIAGEGGLRHLVRN
jgi:ribose 5-phosphate isomerase A